MSDGQIAFGIKRLNELEISMAATPRPWVSAPSPRRAGRPTYDLMVAADLLPKDTDWHKAFTTQFVKDLKIIWR